MCKHRLMLVVAAGVVAAGVLTMQAFSQQGQGGPPAGGGGGQGGGRGGMRFDPEQMRQMIMTRIKETLGATDEEWKVLGPKVEKVQTLFGQLRSGGQRGMFGGGRGGRQEAAPAQPARDLSAVEKAAEDLRTTLENKDAKPDDVKKKLAALREAREKAKQDLAQAQDELRQLLTVKQEAQLVLMNLLD